MNPKLIEIILNDFLKFQVEYLSPRFNKAKHIERYTITSVDLNNCSYKKTFDKTQEIYDRLSDAFYKNLHKEYVVGNIFYLNYSAIMHIKELPDKLITECSNYIFCNGNGGVIVERDIIPPLSFIYRSKKEQEDHKPFGYTYSPMPYIDVLFSNGIKRVFQSDIDVNSIIEEIS